MTQPSVRGAGVRLRLCQDQNFDRRHARAQGAASMVRGSNSMGPGLSSPGLDPGSLGVAPLPAGHDETRVGAVI